MTSSADGHAHRSWTRAGKMAASFVRSSCPSASTKSEAPKVSRISKRISAERKPSRERRTSRSAHRTGRRRSRSQRVALHAGTIRGVQGARSRARKREHPAHPSRSQARRESVSRFDASLAVDALGRIPSRASRRRSGETGSRCARRRARQAGHRARPSQFDPSDRHLHKRDTMNLVRIFDSPAGYVLHTNERHPVVLFPKPTIQSMGTTGKELVTMLRSLATNLEITIDAMQKTAELDMGPR